MARVRSARLTPDVIRVLARHTLEVSQGPAGTSPASEAGLPEAPPPLVLCSRLFAGQLQTAPQKDKDEEATPSSSSTPCWRGPRARQRASSLREVLDRQTCQGSQVPKQNIDPRRFELLYLSAAKRQQKREEKAKRAESEEAAELQPPQIDAESRRIASKDRRPVVERVMSYQRIREQTTEAKRKQQERLVAEDQATGPWITPLASSQHRSVEDLHTWDLNRRRQLSEMQTRSFDRELEGCTFHPQITRPRSQLCRRQEKDHAAESEALRGSELPARRRSREAHLRVGSAEAAARGGGGIASSRASTQSLARHGPDKKQGCCRASRGSQRGEPPSARSAWAPKGKDPHGLTPPLNPVETERAWQGELGASGDDPALSLLDNGCPGTNVIEYDPEFDDVLMMTGLQC